ncbi:hypothetical protein ACJMK2_031431 [Sinanodonta woodiana]|uniref:Mediator of RNA polymerase II transcription subunit 16 n=2 Tax=Sinanodonta woodiana TaxID=1069815 RepID=A0ABD3X074_SINWO
MELFYSVSMRRVTTLKDWIYEEKSCLSVSCKNVLAFSQPTDDENSDDKFNIQYEVAVLDLDKPWEPYQVTVTTKTVVQIEWDHTGNKLLVVDSEGLCQVWQMQDYLLNIWSLLGQCWVTGEEVLAACWFHNGLQVLFDPDKRDMISYTDKFTRNSRLHPSLVQFGSSHLDGWLVITATGLVCVGVIMNDGEIITATQSLAPGHLRLCHADIAHTGSGEILVATSDGLLTSAIQCYIVSLKLQQKSVIISCKVSASLYLKTQMEYGSNDCQNMKVTSVSFLNNDCSDLLLICCGNSRFSNLEVWHLLEQMMPLHKIFSMNTAQDTMNKTPKWMHKATLPHNSPLVSKAGPKLPMSRNLGETTGFIPYFAIAYKDGTVQLIHRYTFQIISTSNVDTLCQTGSTNKGSGDKKMQLSHVTSLIQTGSGCGIVLIHNGYLNVVRTYSSSRDSAMHLPSSSIVLLLEYTMVTGRDFWDVLLAVRQGMIMSVSQSLTDNFQKQTHNIQEYIFMRLLSLKVALFGSYTAGIQKAGDCHARLVLHAISTAIRGVLRPKAAAAQDKSPAERVSIMCSKHIDGDLNSIISSLDIDEFHVDPRTKDKSSTTLEGSLLSMQPLTQWVADFSLQLLSSVRLYQSYSTFAGSSLLSDHTVLGLLRELIIIIRIWGMISPACIPVFTTTSYVDQLDCLSQLYKLLTRAWALCKEGRGLEYDDTLFDECCVLPSKVLIPSLNQSFCMDRNGFSIFTQQFPLSFTFGEEPDYLYQGRQSLYRFMPESPLARSQQHDIVRQIHLGVRPSETTRQCSRCGCQSLLRNIAKSDTMKAWEQRWAKHCLCGGHWKQSK